MSKKIIFSGGGTGGHIFPAINLMKHFFEKKYKVLLVTDKRGSNFIKNNTEFKSYILRAATPTNKNLIKKVFSLFLIFYSIIKSILILKREKPDLVFGLGGYVSFPISFASKFFNCPLIIYENNMVLGRTNRYLSSFSKKIFLSKSLEKNFPENLKNKIHEVGAVIDKKIINYTTIKKNKKKNSLSVLVLGGSQGAEIFGRVVPAAIKMIKDKNYEIEINQQCTINQKNYLIDFYKKNNIKNYIFEFDRDILKLALSSNFAITRCGASTTAELVHTLTPFIAVPIPNSIDNHQYLNAKYYENKGCCWILEQNNFNTENLFNLIMENIENKNNLENVRNNMKKNYNNKAYSNIENKIKELI
jgi:UDP-N-acetylglucosamine--N-acetylmuramyl-(pentapeptide) pyrophosphoryl-undecaprenol N-acetylglucosamine transferase